MKLINEEEITYVEKTFQFEDGAEYSVRLYNNGIHHSYHNYDGYQLDESTDDFHFYDLPYILQIQKFLNLPD